MMPIPSKEETSGFTFQNYLEWEAGNETKHEYFAGQVFAMAGATENHDMVCINFLTSLHIHLKEKPCRVHTADMKLKVEFKHAEASYYPDMMVVCDPDDSEPLFKTRPQAIVEVMSDFRRDNVEKFMVYQSIPSLEEYVVVDQDPDAARAWVYTRSSGWDVELVGLDGNIELPSLGFTIPLKDLYAS